MTTTAMLMFLISGTIAAALAGIAEIIVTSVPPSFGIDLTSWEPGASGAQAAVFIAGIFLIALTEESVKFAVLRKQTSRIPDLSPFVPSLSFGIGFAAAEIGLLSLSNPLPSVPLMPLVGIAAIHILTTLSYGLIPASTPRIGYLLALLVGTGAHAFYNVFLALA